MPSECIEAAARVRPSLLIHVPDLCRAQVMNLDRFDIKDAAGVERSLGEAANKPTGCCDIV